jgi:signal transduction histidine kinase
MSSTRPEPGTEPGSPTPGTGGAPQHQPQPPYAPADRRRAALAQFGATVVRLFHEYANWLVGISWKRFFALSLLLLIITAMLQKVPPFSMSWTEEVRIPAVHPKLPEIPKAPPVPPVPPMPSIRIEPPSKSSRDDISIQIDKNGIRIGPRTPQAAASAASAAPAPSAAASAVGEAATTAASAVLGAAAEIASAVKVDKNPDGTTTITLPGATREQIREAAQAAREAAREARQQAREAAEEARQQAEEARQEAEDARREAEQAVEEAKRDIAEAVADAQRETTKYSRRVVHFGDSLPDLAFLWIIASAILKITYKGRKEAEVKAAAATETAESEQLKRQVVEARMAAMQAQVEPHFLFNTLASIDHLIETDPARASQMQKNLIALLRASMPTMRENHPTAHNLGREMAVIRPYLEILKVRMEDRLQTQIDVPDGLLSADFPSMMIQSLVENAIKHGLEPKAEGGTLRVKAEIVHGKLAVTVADTGLGFGKAATAGTGVGLANIRERLKLLYGNKASMTIGENAPSGTVVTITVPYQAQAHEGEPA